MACCGWEKTIADHNIEREDNKTVEYNNQILTELIHPKTIQSSQGS